jgi:hypothetical protein
VNASAPAAGLTALIVASRGGPALQQTVEAVAFARRRCVIDPAGVLGATETSAAIEPWTPAAAAGWVLLLVEGEFLSAGAAGVLDEVTRGAGPAYRLPVTCEAFGGSVRLAGGALRLARGASPSVRPRLGGDVALAASTTGPTLAGVSIVRRLPPLPREAVDELNADATALAALAAAAGVRPRALRLPLGGLIGGGRVLLGRGSAPLGWGRWIAAGLAGYRALLAEAKLWEREQLGMPAPS